MTTDFEPIAPVLQQLFYEKTLRREAAAKRTEESSKEVVDSTDKLISLVKGQTG